MVQSVASRTIKLPARPVFDRLTALRNHERLIGWTRISAPERRPRVGDVAVATSLGFIVDTMELVSYQPPVGDAVGRAMWVKRGPALHGEAEIVVSRLTDAACRVDWIERDVRLPGLTLSTRPLTALLGVMTRLALARFDRLVQHSARIHPDRHP